MKKIAIMSLPLSNNFGGIWQFFALNMAIKELGFNPKALNLCLMDNKKSYHLLNSFKNYIKKGINSINQNLKFDLYRPNILRKNVLTFLNKNLDLTKQIYSFNELRDVLKEFDCIVLGSDQIFKPSFFVQFSPFCGLDFFDGKKIAYAGSFGGNKFLGDIKTFKNSYEKFDFLSVRESSGVDIFKNTFNLKAKLCLDPTFLIDFNRYFDFKKINKEYILFYNLDFDEKKEDFKKRLAKRLNLDVIDIYGEKANLDPLEWLNLIKNAKFILTDSFHGCVFSIIFKKNFLAFVNNDRGNSRFIDLFNMLDLKEQEVNYLLLKDDYINVRNIDYERVYKILDKKKQESIEFLKKSLSDE